jgi:uncharacterized protein (DUF1499 family)
MGSSLKIIAVLIAFAVALTGGAIAANRVPLTDPPGLVQRLVTYLTRNTARTSPDHELPELRTRVYALPPDRALDLTLRAVENAGWRVVDAKPGSNEIHAVVATPWLRFRDDVNITLTEAPGGGTRVQVESQSRVGRADFGANIAHVMELYRRVDAIVRAEAGKH